LGNPDIYLNYYYFFDIFHFMKNPTLSEKMPFLKGKNKNLYPRFFPAILQSLCLDL